MLLSAPAKLNLTFEIVGRREDGYHYIRSEMQTIFLHDYLWIEKSDEFMYTGALLSPIEDLLITRAVKALERHTGRSLPIWVHLDKVIPMGAGLGGGASDAAATLHGLNEIYQLGLSKEELMTIGVGVGADIPFFLVAGKCLVEGIGERVTPLPPDKEPCYFVLFRPHQRFCTTEAYQEYDRTGKSFADMARQKCPQLEEVFKRFPDAVISGKGPTAFIKRRQQAEPNLPEVLNELIPQWDGDIFITGPDR